MKLHAAKHPRVGEDERVTFDSAQAGLHGSEHEMVVFLRGVAGRLGAELAAHAEMDAEPRAAGKAEEHLLRGGLGAEVARARERGAQGGGIGAAENFRAVVREHGGDFCAARGEVPAFAEEVGFGEFGHAGK